MLKTEPFKRFCPEVGEDCKGKRCASFFIDRSEQDEIDKCIETTITTKKQKKEYWGGHSITETHVCGVIHTLYYACSKFPHLNNTLTENKECDLWRTTHGPRDYRITLACKPQSYTKDFKQEEKEIVLT